jgi:hypothetical protein
VSTGRRFLRRLGGVLVAFLVVLTLIVVGFVAWASIVLQGERPAAIEAWTNPAISITSTDSAIVIAPTGKATSTGLVFIPGAKVDPYAYMFKLSGIVEESGVTVVITKPTLNLAFFDQRPLSTFTDAAPEVTDWFVGGHSLGGVRACMLADDPAVSGVVLFGSFCANDLSATSLKVLSIGGSEDGLSTPQKISDEASLLPASASFVEIDGLNHAGFGNYGVQSGDGIATITSAEARTEITAALVAFFG